MALPSFGELVVGEIISSGLLTRRLEKAQKSVAASFPSAYEEEGGAG